MFDLAYSILAQFAGQFDLFAASAPAPSAGPASRTTRRALNERREVIAGSGQASSRINYNEAAMADIKGKGKAEPANDMDDGEEFKPKLTKGKGKATEGSPAPGKKGVKGKKGAAALPAAAIEAPPSGRAAKGKAKRLMAGETAEDIAMTEPPKAQVPVKRKAPVPFLPSNAAKRLRDAVPPPPDPTHPLQVVPAAKHGLSLNTYLNSFTALSGNPEPHRDLTSRIGKEARLLNRIDLLKSEGRLQSSNPDRKVAGDSKRKEDHTNHLVEAAIQMGKLFIEERKARLAGTKKISRGMQLYFEGLVEREERKHAELQRDLKALAKWTVKQVRKKWKLAVEVRSACLSGARAKCADIHTGHQSQGDRRRAPRASEARQDPARRHPRIFDADARRPHSLPRRTRRALRIVSRVDTRNRRRQ